MGRGEREKRGREGGEREKKSLNFQALRNVHLGTR